MSQAHRPTWNPTQGRETKAGSQQVSKRGLASHTKLKFRQPGQVTIGDVAKRDLRAELAAAERVAEDKKRKAAGLPPLPPIAGALRIGAGSVSLEEGGEDGVGKTHGEGGGEDEEQRKRRKVLEEAAELDRDDSDEDDDDEDSAPKGKDKGKGKAMENGNGGSHVAGAADDDDEEDDDDDDSDDDSDEEDETAALMAELAKIKAERAEEKARLDAESSAAQAASREEEIATGNPLLNLQAALGQTPSSASTASTTFAVKRRWDDDRIFKNQAAGLDDKPKKGEFVNDLLRSEFHKKFMLK